MPPGVPICDGCPDNATLTYDHCKVHTCRYGNNNAIVCILLCIAQQHPGNVVVDQLVAYANNQSALGTIDNVSNIAGSRTSSKGNGTRGHPIYLYRGTHDTCYKTGAEETTLMFYSRLTGACIPVLGAPPSLLHTHTKTHRHTSHPPTAFVPDASVQQRK